MHYLNLNPNSNNLHLDLNFKSNNQRIGHKGPYLSQQQWGHSLLRARAAVVRTFPADHLQESRHLIRKEKRTSERQVATTWAGSKCGWPNLSNTCFGSADNTSHALWVMWSPLKVDDTNRWKALCANQPQCLPTHEWHKPVAGWSRFYDKLLTFL